jgi:hypothetical protein
MRKLTRKTLVATALASAGVLFLQQPGVASPATLRAFGVSVNALGLTLAETPVATVANPNATLVNVSVDGLLNSGTLATSVAIDPDTGTETASASVENADVTFLAASVTAGVLQAQCTAVVGQTPTGAVSIVNGAISGPLGIPTINLASSPAPNSTFGIPGIATIVANEQIVNGDGSLTVNALHVTILGPNGGDVILSSATCGPAAAPVPMISAQGALAAGGLVVLGFAGVRGWRMTRRRASQSA